MTRFVGASSLRGSIRRLAFLPGCLFSVCGVLSGQGPAPITGGALTLAGVERNTSGQTESRLAGFRSEDLFLAPGSGFREGLWRSPATRRRAGVDVDWIDRSDGSREDLQVQQERIPFSGFHLLDLQVSYDVRPPFVEERMFASMTDLERPPESPQMRGIRNLVTHQSFRQLRRLLKKNWREQFHAHPSMSYSFYEERLLAISQIGRDSGSSMDVRGEYYSGLVRDRIFERHQEGEKETPVLGLGPLVLMDSGEVDFDFSAVRRSFEGDGSSEPIEVLPKPGSRRQPLFQGNTYRINPRLRLSVDPFRYLKRGEIRDVVRSYGAVLEVTWLTDILRREIFSTELEFQYKHRDDMALFFNLVISSR